MDQNQSPVQTVILGSIPEDNGIFYVGENNQLVAQQLRKVTPIKIKAKFGVPEQASIGASGFDLKAVLKTEIPEKENHFESYDLIINPGERKLVKTEIYLEMPIGMEAQVRPRSGLALKKGVTVLNSPGTIDSDYRGEVGVILINHGDQPFHVQDGDRIAQLVFAKTEGVILQMVTEESELNQTQRGAGGFGSTGVSNKEEIPTVEDISSEEVSE